MWPLAMSQALKTMQRRPGFQASIHTDLLQKKYRITHIIVCLLGHGRDNFSHRDRSIAVSWIWYVRQIHTNYVLFIVPEMFGHRICPCSVMWDVVTQQFIPGISWHFLALSAVQEFTSNNGALAMCVSSHLVVRTNGHQYSTVHPSAPHINSIILMI